MAKSAAVVPDGDVEVGQEFKNGYVHFTIQNVEVWWAKLDKPDTAFGNNKWCLEMRLSDEVAAQMKAKGFNVTTKIGKDGTVVAKNKLNAKKEVMLKDGTKQDPPKVVGLDGKTPFTQSIGNGSICNVKCSAKAWPIRGKWQVSCYVESVQVVKHVAYDNSGFTDLTGGDDVPF